MNTFGYRRRNTQRDVASLMELLRAVDLEHTGLELEEVADEVRGKPPELGKLLGAIMLFEGSCTCG